MRTQQLLSSTAIPPTLSFISLKSIRESAIGLAKKGNGVRAVRLLRDAFFHSNLSAESDYAKKLVLRATWSAIEKELQERFEAGLKEDMLMIGEAYEWEWEIELKLGNVYSTGEVLWANMLAERDITLKIGRCDELVLLACDHSAPLAESSLIRMEGILASLKR